MLSFNRHIRRTDEQKRKYGPISIHSIYDLQEYKHTLCTLAVNTFGRYARKFRSEKMQWARVFFPEVAQRE